MVLQLQDSRAPVKPLILLDGSHKFVTTHTGIYRDLMNIHDDNQAEAVALSSFAEKFGLDPKVNIHDVESIPSQFVSSPEPKAHR